MPKRARSASDTTWGGRSARRRHKGEVTPTGRDRSSHRWTAAAAVIAQQQILTLQSQWQVTRQAAVERVIADEAEVDAFVEGTHVAGASKGARTLIREIFLDKHQKVCKYPDRLQGLAQLLRERIRAHAGPPRSLGGSSTDARDGPVQQQAWLDAPGEGPSKLRPPPPSDGRLLRCLKNWGVERLGDLPDYAVACVERAEGRVVVERRQRGLAEDAWPSLSLLRAIIQVDKQPTLLASPGDHFWLVKLGRWASVTETMRLFGIQDTDRIWHTLAAGKLTARIACMALGRSVHVAAALHVMRMALDTVRSGGSSTDVSVRYASQCSGIDLFATALDRLTQGGWRYVAAAEMQSNIRGVLSHTYGPLGLTQDAIVEDARDARRIPDVDIWTWSPPCEPFSKRNHSRSDGHRGQALREVLCMLDSVRVSRPRVLLVENVAEPEAVEAVTAALLSVPGYRVERVTSDARNHGSMARERQFWVAVRVGTQW